MCFSFYISPQIRLRNLAIELNILFSAARASLGLIQVYFPVKRFFYLFFMLFVCPIQYICSFTNLKDINQKNFSETDSLCLNSLHFDEIEQIEKWFSLLGDFFLIKLKYLWKQCSFHLKKSTR